MLLQESGEMYLETIYILSKTNSDVRSIDIARKLNFSKPSVSRAINLLKEDGYINVDSKGYIALSDKGYQVASTIYERHIILSDFFKSIGVSEETATKDACRIEHVISDETMNRSESPNTDGIEWKEFYNGYWINNNGEIWSAKSNKFRK